MSVSKISYAQNKEDVTLMALLKNVKRGFYVDVGANHPVHESVTKMFYEEGWSGINIEPANGLHLMLCADRPRDINLKVGISNRPDRLVFREYTRGNGLSTFSGETQTAYKKSEFYSYFAEEYVDYEVPVTTLAQILAEHAPDKRIDFLKIDVEGYEYEAVEGNDWKKYRPVILCIEANHIVKDWHPILEKAGYQKIFWDGLNEYFVAKEHSDLTKNFSYAEDVFLGPGYISWKEKRKITGLERLQRQTEYKLYQAQQAFAAGTGHSGPVLPTSFKGFVKYAVWETGRGFEHYINRPVFPKPAKALEALPADIDEQAAMTLMKKSLLKSVTHNEPFWHRTVRKTFLKLKNKARNLRHRNGKNG